MDYREPTRSGFKATYREIVLAIIKTMSMYKSCDGTLLSYSKESIFEENFEDIARAIDKVLLGPEEADQIQVRSMPGRIILSHLEMSAGGRLTYDRCFVGFISATFPGIFDTDRPEDDDIQRRLEEGLRIAADSGAVPDIAMGKDCIHIEMGDSLWINRSMTIPFLPYHFHHLPVSHLLPFCREVLGAWSYATSQGGIEDMRSRMSEARWNIAGMIAEVPNCSLMNLGIRNIEREQYDYVLHLEAEIFGLGHTLDPDLTFVEIIENNYSLQVQHIDHALKRQKKRNTAKRRAGDGWMMVDRVMAAYLLPLLERMDQQSFDELFMFFWVMHRSDSVSKENFEKNTGFKLPDEIEEISMKDGVLSGAINITDDLRWKNGKLRWMKELPAAMSAGVKGRPAREVIDIPILEGMKISGSRRNPDGPGHIFSFSNSQARYFDVLTRP